MNHNRHRTKGGIAVKAVFYCRISKKLTKYPVKYSMEKIKNLYKGLPIEEWEKIGLSKYNGGTK